MPITPIYIITIFLIIVAIGIIFLVLLYQKRQLQYLKEKQQLQSAFQQALLQAQLEIQEQTFKKISQEIHDNIGQVLSLVKLNINTIDCSKPDSLPEKINDTKKLVGKVIQDLRDLSRSLNADLITELGLIKLIDYELDMLRKAGNYTVVFSTIGEPFELPGQKELILFRIFQEVLNNIIKHANASEITTIARYQQNKLLLTISDNGTGFDISSLGNKEIKHKGIGISNMKNRSHLIGAQYSLVSQYGKGTTVMIELPVE